MLSFPLIVLIILLIIIVLIRMQNNDLPGPMRIPIVGNIQLCMTKPSEFLKLARYFKEIYGDAFLMYMFNTPFLFVSHPKYASPILASTELLDKGVPYQHFIPWLGRGLLTDSGLRWKAHRKLLTSAFHVNIIQNFLPVFLRNEKILIKKLKEHVGGEAFDLFPILTFYTLDNVTELIMGVEIGAQMKSESEYVKSIQDITRIIALRIQNPLAGNDTLFEFMSEKKVHDKALEVLHGTTENVIRMRRKALAESTTTNVETNELGIKNKYAFLDLLLQSEVNGSKIDDLSIREQVDTFLFAGYDSTTTAIVFTLYCISKHEDVQQKLLDEQMEILDGDLYRDPSYTEIQRMKYLDMVIKESLRIYPPVPFIERLLTKDTEIGGLQVKKDTSVMINIFELQHHPELYEDPLEFRPDRFDPANSHDVNALHWLIFSAGPRNCIGQKFAMLEIKATVASIIKHFKVLPVEQELHLCSELVLRSKTGVKVKLEER